MIGIEENHLAFNNSATNVLLKFTHDVYSVYKSRLNLFTAVKRTSERAGAFYAVIYTSSLISYDVNDNIIYTGVLGIKTL